MVVCRSHDRAGSLAHGVFISRPTCNPDQLPKSRPSSKIQTHWLGHKVVHIVIHNIKILKSCFHQYFIYIHKFNKRMAYNENHMVDRSMRIDSSHCEESFLTHLSTVFSYPHPKLITRNIIDFLIHIEKILSS